MVEERLADAGAVADAERHARRVGLPLVAALVELTQIGDAAIARALSRRLNLAVTSVLEPEPEALREVAQALAHRYRALPLALELPLEGQRVLRIAMADPTDEEALSVLEATSGCRIEAVLAALGAVDDAIDRAYRGFVTVVMQRSDTLRVHATEPPPTPRKPFGGDLNLGTAPIATQPFHQLEDEAPVEMRLRALLTVLEHKGLVSLDEYLEQIRKLLQERE